MNQNKAMARRVAARYAFKYEPKEKKEHKVDRLKKEIADKTGVSKGLAEDIADALVRGRDVLRLAIQKGWDQLTEVNGDPILEGPKGKLELASLPV